MNERIMEYAKEARLYAQGIYPEVNDIKEWGQVYHEKFAQLIVRECLTVINDSKEYKTPQDGWNEHDAGWNPALEQAEENIKQHFGVEE